MISEREFYSVLLKDAAVEAAWRAANVAFFKAATTPSGLRSSFSRMRRRRGFEASVSNLLQEYDRAIGCRHRASDLAALRIMVAKDVADRDRSRLVRRLEMILETPPCDEISRATARENDTVAQTWQSATPTSTMKRAAA